MASILPETFDLIVLGTGLQESLVAAAASLSGLSVLHLDTQSEYGSLWAGLTLDRFLEWAEQQQLPIIPGTPQPQVAIEQQEGSPAPIELPLSECSTSIYSNVEVQRWTVADLGSLRQYTIDLAPKLLYTVGPMVESLLRCKADSYLTFRLVHNFVWQDGRITSVPASRADIFKNSALLPGDKRVLMRFLKGTIDALNGDGPLKDAFDERPFTELLSQQGLPPRLQQLILYSLAMLNTAQTSSERAQSSTGSPAAPSLPTADAERAVLLRGCQQGITPTDTAVEADATASDPGRGSEATASAAATSQAALAELSRYVESMSRFGGAFMTADYGSGELPQAFCRTAAVHGAVYVLRCGLKSILLDSEQQTCIGVRTAADQVLRCGALAAQGALLPTECVSGTSGTVISRGVAILERPLEQPGNAANTASQRQMLLTVPPNSIAAGIPQHPVRVLQLGVLSQLAPQGRFVLHLSTVSCGASASAELQPVLASLLSATEQGSQESQPLMTVFYSQRVGFRAGRLPRNVALCQPPDEGIGYGEGVSGAEVAFKKLFPDREFLPALPQEGAIYDSD